MVVFRYPEGQVMGQAQDPVMTGERQMNWKTKIVLGLMVLSVCLAGLPLKEDPEGLGGFISISGAKGTKVHPVILIHGLGGEAEMWEDKSRGYTIHYTLQADGYDMEFVKTFAYPPGPGQEDSCGDVRLIAEGLAQEVDRLSQDTGSKVDIVAHSLGGLVTRQYLSQHLHGHNVGKFIDIATPHQGSKLMVAYNDAMDGLAEYLTDDPEDNWITRAVIDSVVHGAWEAWNLKKFIPNPTTPAAQQLDPRSDFLRGLNQPGLSPMDVDYSMIYGDISLQLEWDVFGIPIASEEIANLGDFLVGRDNASTIPSLGTRQGPNPSNYHTYGFSDSLTVRPSLVLNSPLLSILDLQARLDQVKHVQHGGLVHNSEVNQRILAILNEDWVEPSPVRPPTGGAETATVLVVDISGSMDEHWRGGVKIESAKAAALDIVNMIEQESQVGNVEHHVAIATFSDYAWLDLPLTTDYNQAQEAINSLRATDRTNIGAGLETANGALQQATLDFKKVVILLSDGKTNEGLSPDGILSGPVQEAVSAHTCIYTIGFGDPGDLDENLLRNIADATGCGKYSYASSPFDLGKEYALSHHDSLGTLIANFSGQVAQGETHQVGQMEVPPDQGELYCSLIWPGSQLDLLLTDPQGQTVDANYPGVTIAEYARFVYLIVTNPLPGLWQMSVIGRDVPEGTTDYAVLASVREKVTPPFPPPGPVDRSALAIALTVFIAITAGIAGFYTLSRRGGLSGRVPAGAGVRVIQGHAPRGRVTFRRGVLGIGRDHRNELVLTDDKVSRNHAQIRQEVGGYVIYDLNSTNSTFVNGQQVSQALLRDGDVIRIGDTELVFHSGRVRPR